MNAVRGIMLGTSFFGKHDVAAATLARFCEALRGNAHVALGLETEESRGDPKVRRLLSEIQRSPFRGYLWDGEFNRAFLGRWPGGLPMPFYRGYSYGGAVNRLLALARKAGCDYLVRIDPGTAPLADFSYIIERHVRMVLSGEALVVSGQYTGRPAIRNDFVPEARMGDYYRLVRESTGVDPSPGRQLTGGAACTTATDSVPAIAFEGVMVWGSDDGFFQTFLEPRLARVVSESRVYRTGPGVTLNRKKYFLRLAYAVVLRQRQLGVVEEQSALCAAQKFLDALADLVDPAMAPIDARNELDIRAVFEGFENYGRLKAAWKEVVAAIDRVPCEPIAW